MKKISQICVLLFILFMLLSNDTLGNQVSGVPFSSIHPCHLIYHGRHFRYRYPNLPNLPLSHGDKFPVRFYLHTDIPRKNRPVVYAAAAELNMKVESQMIEIQSKIDNGDMNLRWGDSKNVIYWDDYWANSGGIESSEEIRAMEAAATFIDPVKGPEPYITISEVDIMIYGEKPNTATGLVRVMFNQSLRRLGLEPMSEDVDLKVLQNRLIERLSDVDREGFYDMVIRLMREKGIDFSPNSSRADIQNWIISAINAERKNAKSLTSFEDFRDLFIEEFSINLEQFDTSVVLKNNMLHEFGHALGLSHHEYVNGLMFDRLLHITPVPRVPRDLLIQNEFDDLAIHGLRCIYDLDRLKQTSPL